MTRFRNAARLIPACGLVLALMVPAASAAAPSVGPSPNVQLDKGGKGHGKQKQEKAHGKAKQEKQKKAKGNKHKNEQQRAEVERQRTQSLRRDRLDSEWERHQAVQRNRARSGWPQSGNLADRPGRGILHVQGEVTAEGIRCAAVRGDDGRLYTLVGDPALRLRPGDDVWIKGRLVSNSACRQGTTLQIQQLRDLDRDGRWVDDRRDDDWDDDRWDDRDARDRQARVGRFVEIEGRLTDESWECRTMRGTDGRLYSLIGDLEGFDEGDRVLVSGRLVSGTGCPGTAIRVDDVRGERGGILDRIFGGSRDDDRDDRWEGDRGELVNLRGRLASSGGCTLLRGDDGRTYELSGNLRGFGRGDSVRIVGVMEGGSRCGLGPGVRVGEIDRR